MTNAAHNAKIFVKNQMYNNEQIDAYVKAKGYIPGTVLWAVDKPLTEDAFRAGNKSGASVDFLRWQDIGMTASKGLGRIPESDYENHMIQPGHGISMFIKRMLPEGMVYAGSSPSVEKRLLKNQFDPLVERHWWKIEPGQQIPAGLQLIFDGEPPGHCTLSVTREMTVKGFLSLVAMIYFTAAGSDYFGIAK